MKNSILFVSLTILMILFGAMTCSPKINHQSNSVPLTKQQEMNDYTEEWKAILALEQKGLVKSALEKVTALYTRAKKENNSPQIVKTILYREKYGSQLEEYGFENSIRTFKEEVNQLNGPAKSLLHFMIGRSLASYLEGNYWKFSNRTTAPTFKPESLETWSIQNFVDEINMHFAEALKDKSLQALPIKAYEVLLTDAINTDDLRPTLYDFVSHQILDYYVNPNSYLTEPVYKFYLDDDIAFAPVSEFVKHSFTTQDSTAHLHKAITLFQDVLAYHLLQNNEVALLDADLKRLNLVFSNGSMSLKGKKYMAALNDLASKNKGKEKLMPTLLMAQANLHMSSRAHLADKKDDLKKAHELYSKILSDYPKANNRNEAKNKISSIESKFLKVDMEKVYPKGENMLTLVSYKNIKKVHHRLYQIEAGEEHDLRNNNRKLLSIIKNKEKISEWTQTIPVFDDFQNHQTEIKIAPLDFGHYVLLTSNDKNFGKDKAEISANFFIVSNLSYVITPNNPEHQMIVVDRITGQPIKGAKVSFYLQEYNSTARKSVLRLKTNGTSDANGMVNIDLDQNNSYMPKVEYGKDVLQMQDWIYKNRKHTPRGRNAVNIFLDRAIYRPGQTVYFKAIAHHVDGESQLPTLLTNQALEVVLKDANRQDVEKLNLTTNEYGSINGSFTTPSSGLLGNMTIQINGYGGTNFSVEEYKRPKFEADFLPIEAEYALSESVKVVGKATGFAGNAIGDAKVAYRVERGVEYPYWRWRYGRYNRQAPMRIKTGEAVSKADGTFDIDFELLPDPSIKKKQQAVFVYKVFADITDISGETRSIQTVIRASELALSLNVSAISPIEADSFKHITISTSNLNGKFQPTEVSLRIASLQSESKLYRDRFWSFPDTVNFTEREFSDLFPSYRFAAKKQAIALEENQEVYREKITSTEDGKLDLSKLSLVPGQYKITAESIDKNGNEIKKELAFEVIDTKAKDVTSPVGLAVQKDKLSYEPGQTALVNFLSSYKDAHVFVALSRRDKSIDENWLKLKTKRETSVAVNQSDLGNISMTAFTVFNNRIYNQSSLIPVPWSNKELKISYASFRDKLLPGQEEEWIIKIEGSKKEKVAAEMLAGMYDASLDEFRPNQWSANYFPILYANYQLQPGSNFTQQGGYRLNYQRPKYLEQSQKVYRQFDWHGFDFYGNNYGWNYAEEELSEISVKSTRAGGRRAKMKSSAPAPQMDGVRVTADAMMMNTDDNVVEESEKVDFTASEKEEKETNSEAKNGPSIRKNLNETVFFFPDLRTDKDGNVLIKFKMNEALTKWKFMTFAHTKELATAISTKEIVTQKKLMVQPNAPRFFREGDKIRFSAKVSNLSEKILTGNAKLELFNALSMESIDAAYANIASDKSFTAKPGESVALFWDLDIPMDMLGTVLHRVVAEAGAYSDGEESALPVLTNRKLVTETMPLPLRAGESKEFVFKTMRDNKSSTLTNHKYTLEFTSNPAWYAVQSLPYLMEYPYECTEQIFNKLYANALASHVANSTPKIKQIFESWKGTDAMKSNLSKNQELKSALLEETPWVLDAQSEEQQRRNIALLFDLNKMSQEKAKHIKVLSERQLSNGGFSWFPGGRDSWYITQYLVEGFGHLQTLGVDLGDTDLNNILRKAVQYIDARLVEHHNEALRYNKNPGLTGMVIHYLYARSFFIDFDMNAKTQKVAKYYQGRAKEQWVDQGLYYQGLLALGLDRFGMNDTAQGIVASLKERALSHEDLGKYWKYDKGYYWHQMPIETHSVMIEVFEQVAKDKEMVDELRLWLLKNKQTNAWETTKATSAAVYALLMSGDSWLQETKQVEIVYPNKQLNADLAKGQANAQAGTGYFKHSWTEVNPNLSSLKVSNPNTVPAWGAAYWQYFEDLDKITDFEETPLKLNKQVFIEKQGDRGATIEPIADGAKLSVGDKLKVRIELRVDRDMEFIHMKDMRASGFEPMNVFSQYKWQGGLGYYESTKDASTNFFFDYLPKGTYVFEYPLRIVHEGDFSNGVTTIQSMYAPEFTSHSKGVRIEVGE